MLLVAEIGMSLQNSQWFLTSSGVSVASMVANTIGLHQVINGMQDTTFGDKFEAAHVLLSLGINAVTTFLIAIKEW